MVSKLYHIVGLIISFANSKASLPFPPSLLSKSLPFCLFIISGVLAVMLCTTSKILLAPLNKLPAIFKVDSKVVISCAICAVFFVKSAAKFQLLAPQAPKKLTKPQTALRMENVLFPVREPMAKPKLIPSVIPEAMVSLTPIKVPSHAPCPPIHQVATAKTIVTIGAKKLKNPLLDFSYT